MNLFFVNKIEITDDKHEANKLLECGWFLWDIVSAPRKGFSFVLLSYDEEHYPGSDGLKKSQ